MRALILLASLLAFQPVFSQDADESSSPATPAAEPSAEAATQSQAEPQAPGVKTLSGMSILGNEEAPKSLVIVPWKSSQIGDGLGVRNALDDRARPVDKDVFMRELRYYELRSGGGE